jgi:two-component system, OmpR family, response regulator
MPKIVYLFDGWRLDAGRRQLIDPDGRKIVLTSSELNVLLVFVQNPQQTIARQDLLPRIGGRVISGDRAVDVRIARIRQKIEKDPRKPEVVKTIRQEGYWFTPDVTVE